MAEISTLKEKILSFLTQMGIKRVDFYEATGVQASNFKGANQRSAPGGEMLVKILTTYPQLSAEWLMRGVGPMLLSEDDFLTNRNIETKTEPHTKDSEKTPEYIVDRLMSSLDNANARISDQSEKIGKLKARVEQLEQELAEVRDFSPVASENTQLLAPAEIESAP